MGAGPATISVVVPSYRRPDDLRRCLEALAAQEVPPAEVVVVHRPGDEATVAVLAAAGPRVGPAPLRTVEVDARGQVAALRAGVEAAGSDVVAFTDDDAAPRADWVARLQRHFAVPAVGAVGGPDQVMVEAGPVRRPPVDRVGMVSRWGRVIGDHDAGVGPARDVDHLRGVNLAVRRHRYRTPVGLRGEGAEVYNDLAMSLAVRRQGARVVYDPDLVVAHWRAPRFDEDRREAPTVRARADAVFNQSLILFSLRTVPPWRRLLYAVVWGDRGVGGLGRCAWARFRGDDSLRGVWWPYLVAHLQAWRTAHRHPLALRPPSPLTSRRR